MKIVSRAAHKAFTLFIMPVMLVLMLVPATTSAAYSSSKSEEHNFADPAFQRVWNHCDKPVEAQLALRSWMWGPDDFYTAYEMYAEGPAGQHLVSYFDKSRMEINDPHANRNTEWFVTNGLLVVDMISGRIQVGNNMFAQTRPAALQVAGDPSAGNHAPTYATLARVASLRNDNRAPNRTGQYVTEGMGSAGTTGTVSGALAGLTRYAVYEPTLGHNIPDIFWTYMNQRGVTYHEDGYEYNDVVVDWLFAMGYPITEPYWIEISVAGEQRWVLMQAFQRRILTYSPYNPDPWKVEMANVGRAYFDWRYSQSNIVTPVPTPPVVPVPTVTPLPAPRIAVDPAQGDVNTRITVTGLYFPPYATVTLGVEKANSGYARTITRLNAKSDGTFRADINLPSDAAQLGDLTIVATANSGGIRATARFAVTYEPFINVTPRELVINNLLRVRGGGFPAQTEIRLSMLLPGNAEALGSINTGGDGTFDFSVTIRKAVGTQFRVAAATAQGSFKVTTDYSITVIRQPVVIVSPNNGPAGANVAFIGNSWPPYRAVNIGLKTAGSPSEGWFPNPVYADAQGKFTITVWIGREYAPYSEVRLLAYDPVSTARLEASYFVTPAAPPPSPTPGPPSISVQPNPIAVGQVATAAGRGWPAGAQVSLGLGRPSIEEPVGVARADANGNFTHSFVISSHWQGAGQVTLTAYIPGGPAATTRLGVLAGGTIVPSGLPMSVWTYQLVGSAVYVSAKGDGSGGWLPDTGLTARIVSADRTLDLLLATTTTSSDGRFSMGGYADASWWSRVDIGIQVSSSEGEQYSLRYVPLTQVSKVPGTANMYQLAGNNWPAATRIEVTLNLDGEPPDIIGTATTDSTGGFMVRVNVPRLAASNKNDLEIRAVNQPYNATIDF